MDNSLSVVGLGPDIYLWIGLDCSIEKLAHSCTLGVKSGFTKDNIFYYKITTKNKKHPPLGNLNIINPVKLENFSILHSP